MAYREFTDGSGTEWRVWDTRPHSAANVRAQYAAGWLSFESNAERRRLGPIPEDWAQATDADLHAMVARAVPVSVRDPRPGPPHTGESPAKEDPPQPSLPVERTRAAVGRARAVIRMIESTFGRGEQVKDD